MAGTSVHELENAFRHFDPQKRYETLKALTDLFLAQAENLDEDGVEVFDKVFDAALEKQNVDALADISERMAPVPNAPVRLIKRLASDAEIQVAGPVLSQSPRLDESDLCEIASVRGNAHLLAISTRAGLTSPVTDILIERGDNEVARTVAGNETAQLSDKGIDRLIERARSDESIGTGLYARSDVPAERIKAALADAEAGAKDAEARIAVAQRLVVTLNQTGELTEQKIGAFAAEGEYEQVVAAISLKSRLKFRSLETMMQGPRLGGLTLVCKSLGFNTTTMNALWKLAVSRNGATAGEVQNARREFLSLTKETAERVVRFWLVRQSASAI